jgi:RHS repeat-associated protein
VGNGSATTTYTYDYANRLTALFAGGATTTYGYDAFGSRMFQVGTTTTTIYPFKWYSVASSTETGAKYSTTTSYMFSGDTLLSTVDQQLAGGAATGTAKTRYVHPDHLGSTNVVTDENGSLVQTLDYYPYGAPRVSVSTSTKERRQFIGQFTDDSGLSYLNARYYNPAQGQFLSEDPVFIALGNQNQTQQLTQQNQRSLLGNPQQLNSYSYAQDNPITKEDPSGKYGEISGAVVIPGRSFSAGLRFDENGVDFFMGGGVGFGFSGGVELAWAPGQALLHQRQGSVSLNAESADVIGGRVIPILPNRT